jgi:replicative DNA helicase
LHPGELWVIAAQTSGGKSALAMQSALLSSRDRGIATAIFSLEMDAHELIERMLSHAGNVSMRSLRGGLLTELESVRLHKGVEKLAPLRMFIEDDFSLGVSGIISRARLLRLKHSIGLVVIDYFQLIDSVSGSDDSREREVSKVGRASKMLARELNIPVIGISQLNDTGQLRESRTIGHHADGVLKLDPSESDEEGIVDITIVKMRNGPRGKRFPVRFDGQFMQFRDR